MAQLRTSLSFLFEKDRSLTWEDQSYWHHGLNQDIQRNEEEIAGNGVPVDWISVILLSCIEEQPTNVNSQVQDLYDSGFDEDRIPDIIDRVSLYKLL